MFGLESVANNVLVVGGVAAALIAIWRVTLGVWRLAKRIEAVHDAVLNELLPNGGSTLVDRVGSIERELDSYKVEQDRRWGKLYRRLGVSDA